MPSLAQRLVRHGVQRVSLDTIIALLILAFLMDSLDDYARASMNYTHMKESVAKCARDYGVRNVPLDCYNIGTEVRDWRKWPPVASLSAWADRRLGPILYIPFTTVDESAFAYVFGHMLGATLGCAVAFVITRKGGLQFVLDTLVALFFGCIFFLVFGSVVGFLVGIPLGYVAALVIMPMWKASIYDLLWPRPRPRPTPGPRPMSPPTTRVTEVVDSVATGSDPTCAVCLVNGRKATFIPCGHFVCCWGCAKACASSDKEKCPMCNKLIEEIIATYQS
jgi:hypothetical protein